MTENNNGNLKNSMLHVAGEIIIIGGLTYMFSKKITELNNKISELQTKIEQDGGDKKFQEFKKETSQHINNLYSIIETLSNNIKMNREQETTPLFMEEPPQVLRNRFTRKEEGKYNNYTFTPEKHKIEVIDEETSSENEDELDDELKEELQELQELEYTSQPSPTIEEFKPIDELVIETDIKNEIFSNKEELTPAAPLEFIQKKQRKTKLK